MLNLCCIFIIKVFKCKLMKFKNITRNFFEKFREDLVKKGINWLWLKINKSNYLRMEYKELVKDKKKKNK